METPWYHYSAALSGRGFFQYVGQLFDSTFNAMINYDYTDFFKVVLQLILFGLVAGFLLYMFRNTRK